MGAYTLQGSLCGKVVYFMINSIFLDEGYSLLRLIFDIVVYFIIIAFSWMGA